MPPSVDVVLPSAPAAGSEPYSGGSGPTSSYSVCAVRVINGSPTIIANTWGGGAAFKAKSPKYESFLSPSDSTHGPSCIC